MLLFLLQVTPQASYRLSVGLLLGKTFLHFAKVPHPFFRLLKFNLDPRLFLGGFLVKGQTGTLWNAVVYEAANGETRFLDMLRESMASEPQLAALVEQLIVRKRSLFADDYRVVGQYKLIRKEGELRLWAEARTPSRATE